MAQRDSKSVQIMLNFGLEKGVSREILLLQTGLSPEQLVSDECSIEAKQELAVLDNLLLSLGNSIVTGIELGLRYPLTSYGMMGYAMLASPTLRSAIEFAIRFMDLTYAFSEARLETSETRFKVSLSTHVPGELGRFVLHRDTFAAIMVIRELFPKQQLPLDLNLAIPADVVSEVPMLQQLAEHLDGKVTFDCEEYSLTGDLSILDAPLVKGHAQTAKACEQQCIALLQQKRQLTEISAKVRDLLLRKGLSTSMEEVSSTLGKTSRTLHRKLKEEGTSFRELKDNVTIDLAKELLKQPLSIEQVAFRLGYTDAANFSHSFKRCTGLSPKAYRGL